MQSFLLINEQIPNRKDGMMKETANSSNSKPVGEKESAVTAKYWKTRIVCAICGLVATAGIGGLTYSAVHNMSSNVAESQAAVQDGYTEYLNALDEAHQEYEDALQEVVDSTKSTNGATDSADTPDDGTASDLSDVGDVYHIEWGDTLSKISKTVGVSVDALANHNEIKNVNLIYANSSLQIPKNETSESNDVLMEETETEIVGSEIETSTLDETNDLN